MVFPLWKSLHSLNLMLPKEERKALLLRLFNDETPLVNLTQKQKNATFAKGDLKTEETDGPPVDRNSSSPERGVPLLDAVEEAIRNQDESQVPDE
jgi:multisite-specific tRNA:(cytosine-C5)-methyltransferase